MNGANPTIYVAFSGVELLSQNVKYARPQRQATAMTGRLRVRISSSHRPPEATPEDTPKPAEVLRRSAGVCGDTAEIKTPCCYTIKPYNRSIVRTAK